MMTVPPHPTILNRTIPGGCHSQNLGTICWGPDGLVAYGCHTSLVIVDPITVQTVQVLTKHRDIVGAVDWAQGGHLQLASGDSTGNIISWDLSLGEHIHQVHDGNQPVVVVKWLPGKEKFLLSVHPPNNLILWNMENGEKVWKYSYGDKILGLDLDPFRVDSLIMRCERSFLLVGDLNSKKCPKSEGRKWCVDGGKNISPGQEQNSGTRNKLRRMVRSVVLGGEHGGSDQCSGNNDCIQAVYHKAVINLVVLAYKKEVLLVDTELDQTVGLINLERAHSPLASLCVARHQEVVYLLHESGSVSLWWARPGLSVAATPQLPKSQSLSLFPSTPLAALTSSMSLLEITYESKVTSDHIRLGKNCHVLGLSLHPVTQTQVTFVTTDGRIFIINLIPVMSTVPPILSLSHVTPSTPLRLSVSAIMSSLTSSTIRMCPPLTVKNWSDYQPLLAVGSQSGNLLLINVSTGVILRELAVHTSPVQGIEWTSSNPAASLLTYAHCPVTGSPSQFVRNELIHTDIRTGKVKHLRSLPGREPEESKITMIRVSQQKQYFVVAFASAPFELWDLRNMKVLRTMPKKFPIISALEWSPLHTSKVKKKGSSSSPEPHSDNLQSSPVKSNKEHILLTDTDGQLYHFTVEGHSIKDGTKIPAETGLGTINSICWKSDLIVRGDSEGNINIWNVKTRQSKNIHTGWGAVRKMRFSPGKSNMKVIVLYKDGVQIWDVKELEMINELRSPTDCVAVDDVEWASSDRVVMSCQDGTIRLAGLALAGTNSPCLAYGRDQLPACLGLLPHEKLQFVSCYLGSQMSRKSLESVLAEDQINLFNNWLFCLGQEFESLVSGECKDSSQEEIYTAVALSLGLIEEGKLWQLLDHQNKERTIGKQFHIMAGRGEFRLRAEEMGRLHVNRAGERLDRVRVTAQLICLGQMESAVTLLLDSDPEEDSYLADQLLACLIQANIGHDGPNNVSTIKMVATNLLSEGKLWEGVQLLCLADKVPDACSYLRSAGHWDHALWLAKCRLDDDQFKTLAIKYSDHLVQNGRVFEAVMIYASIGFLQGSLKYVDVDQNLGLTTRLLTFLRDEEGLAEAQERLVKVMENLGQSDLCNQIIGQLNISTPTSA